MLAKQKYEKTTAKIAFCETKTYERRKEKDKIKLKPYCVSLKNGIFQNFSTNRGLMLFPTKAKCMKLNKKSAMITFQTVWIKPQNKKQCLLYVTS